MFSPLRVVGLVLLLGGFTWLALGCFVAPATQRPVVAAHFQALPKADTITMTRREMMKEIHDVAAGVIVNQPRFFRPGCTMLVGGLLLAFVSPRSRPSA